MEIRTSLYKPRIVRKEIELRVPHNDKEIVFSYPYICGDYRTAGEKILDKNQLASTGDCAASLFCNVYCSEELFNEAESRDIISEIKGNWFWIYNRNLWTRKGVYVFQDLEAIGLGRQLDEEHLEKKLMGGKEIGEVGVRVSEDGMVRFAPKESYKLGENSLEDFSKSGFIIASCLKEGAEKFGMVSAKFRNKPRICGVETEISVQTVSAVYVYGKRFNFYGDKLGDNKYGRALGIFRC